MFWLDESFLNQENIWVYTYSNTIGIFRLVITVFDCLSQNSIIVVYVTLIERLKR